MIDSFKGDYYFLSNFYPAPVMHRGLVYQNNEAAFQAMKCENPSDRMQFTELSPSEAKRLGRSIKLRDDWESVKESEMYYICVAKFVQNPDIAKKLMNTRGETLVEGNDWGDKIWGMVDGVGENKLGNILMSVRARLQLTSKGGRK